MTVKEREDELADLLAAKTAECQRLRDHLDAATRAIGEAGLCVDVVELSSLKLVELGVCTDDHAPTLDYPHGTAYGVVTGRPEDVRGIARLLYERVAIGRAP